MEPPEASACMPITYTIDRERLLIHEKWTGEIRAADVGAYWKAYLANPEVLAIRRTLVDLRPAIIRFSGLEFESLIQTIVLPSLGKRKWTTAVVVGDPVQFGVSRQYHVFAAIYSKDCIFKSVDEAEAWILSAEAAQPG
jgi:hypothetical protein